MTIKIGDMLIKAGIITMPQLDEALKQQVAYGGKLGTNLIEMGYIDEEALAFFLGEKLGVPYVHPSQFDNVPQEAIDLISKDLVEKHKIFPVEVRKNVLNLVMTDPTDLALIDEISFMTNMQIRPVVAPEIRLIFAFEKYYGIEKDLRYISLNNTTHVSPTTETLEATARDMKDLAIALETEEDEILGGLDFITIEEEIEPDVEGAHPVPIEEEVIRKYTVDEISMDMARSEDREEVAQHMIDYINQKFSTAAVFVLRDKYAVGWKASGPSAFVETVTKIKLAISDHMPFKRVHDTKQCYLGSCRNSPVNKTNSNSDTDSELIMPIIMGDDVVSFLYVCGAEKAMKEALFEYNCIATKASLAFEMLVIKNKIMMT